MYTKKDVEEVLEDMGIKPTEDMFSVLEVKCVKPTVGVVATYSRFPDKKFLILEGVPLMEGQEFKLVDYCEDDWGMIYLSNDNQDWIGVPKLLYDTRFEELD